MVDYISYLSQKSNKQPSEFNINKSNYKFSNSTSTLSIHDEVNYDEELIFTHNLFKFKIFESEGKNQEGFPYLMNHEFILGGSLSYHSDKKISEMNNKELLMLVKNKSQAFLVSTEYQFK